MACELPFAQSSPTPVWSIEWQDTPDRLKALHQGLGMPAHLSKAPAIKLETDFDVNRYFTVLNHLSMESGYQLDYAYNFSSIGGLPILYGRSTGTAPYQTYNDYARAEPGQEITSYLEKIRTDGTPEGYYQLAVLAQLGSQFYLYWHAANNDTQIVADRATLEKLINDLKAPKSGYPLTADQAAKARTIDPQPQIEFGSENVTVRYVTFTKWGGFRRSSFVFHKEFPHRIVDRKTETLVEYQCGIVF